jgi:glucose-6-phosphate 1-dehydrogenase
MVLGHSLLWAYVAKHIQLLLVFSTHTFFLSGCAVETRQFCGTASASNRVFPHPVRQDLASAQRLNGALHAVLPESRIFRIDHYLGKEAVLKLLFFRFANRFLERIWNRDCGLDRLQTETVREPGISAQKSY